MMSQKKADPAAVSTFADHEVILPPNKLKKAVQKVKPGTKIDFDPVANAEAALAELAEDFSGWMDQECTRLDAARNAMKASGISNGTRDALFLAAHDIKGQATTFGYPLVQPVAGHVQPCPADRAHARHDADSARSGRPACRCGARDHAQEHAATATASAAKLAEKLRHVTEEFLAHENRDRPEYLGGRFSRRRSRRANRRKHGPCDRHAPRKRGIQYTQIWWWLLVCSVWELDQAARLESRTGSVSFATTRLPISTSSSQNRRASSQLRLRSRSGASGVFSGSTLDRRHPRATREHTLDHAALQPRLTARLGVQPDLVHRLDRGAERRIDRSREPCPLVDRAEPGPAPVVHQRGNPARGQLGKLGQRLLEEIDVAARRAASAASARH